MDNKNDDDLLGLHVAEEFPFSMPEAVKYVLYISTCTFPPSTVPHQNKTEHRMASETVGSSICWKNRMR